MLPNDETIKCPSIFHEAFNDPFLIERFLLIIYTLIFFIGLVGNIMTIIIIEYNTHLRTPTNFYLLNLAVSDLMILMCNLPLEMIEIHYGQWPLPIIFCRLRNICAEFFTCSSILTILAFTCERYFAIVHPIHFHRLSHFRRAQNIICIIWTISLIFSIPFGFSYEIDSYPTKIHSTRMNATMIPMEIICKSCVPKKSIEKLLSIIIIITSICLFYLPMMIIGTIYFFIGKALRQVNRYEDPSRQIELSLTSLSSLVNIERKLTNKFASNSSLINKVTIDMKPKNNHVGSYSWLKTRARCKARKAVVKTLVAVVIAFFVCYAPLYLQRLLLAIMQINTHLTSDSSIFSRILAYLYVISGVTFYFGSVINPILYNLVSNKYRRAFGDLFCCRLTCQKQSQRKSRTNNRSGNQPVHYIVRKPPSKPSSPQANSPFEFDPKQIARFNACEHEHRPVSSNSHSSRSNPSSLSSHQQRDDYSIRSLNSHGSLAKECQVAKDRRFSLRRQLLGQKSSKETVSRLIAKNRV